MNNRCICWFSMHPLNADLNHICHLLALLGGATILVISRLILNITHLSAMISYPHCYKPHSISKLRIYCIYLYSLCIFPSLSLYLSVFPLKFKLFHGLFTKHISE